MPIENMEFTRVSVVILTFNEAINLPYALKSVEKWSDDIHIVDSGSTDNTLDIAKSFNAFVHYHPWEDWAAQRNWALENCALRYQWVLFLDADEQLTTESRREICQLTDKPDMKVDGYYLTFNFYFMGRLVRNAMRSHLRLVRKNKVRWHVEGAREYSSAPTNSPTIHSKLMHVDHRGIDFWINKQLRNADLEARRMVENNYFLAKNGNRKSATKFEFKIRCWVRDVLNVVCPPTVRPFIYFFYRLFIKTDIRDGWAGLLYAFLFGFWYPMMIEVKYIEMLNKKLPKGSGE